MDNLHRELAPISSEGWADLEAEARRTFTAHVAGRRAVDVIGPSDEKLAAVGTGHVHTLGSPADGVRARSREAQPMVEIRVPFVVDRQAVDDVARGARDVDWQPVKDAARKIAFVEDRAIFDGYPILEHIVRVLGAESEIIWAPAIDGAFLLSTRGGDYELHLGQDLSIGYLSHDENSIELYFQESLTFIVLTGEAGVEMTS